jgi:hypothetical protein
VALAKPGGGFDGGGVTFGGRENVLFSKKEPKNASAVSAVSPAAAMICRGRVLSQ